MRAPGRFAGTLFVLDRRLGPTANAGVVRPGRYEFATTVRHYYGRTWYTIFQVFYNLALQTSNIAAMVISAQVAALASRSAPGLSWVEGTGLKDVVAAAGRSSLPR